MATATKLEKLRKSVGGKADESMGATRSTASSPPKVLHGATLSPPDPRWEGVDRARDGAFIPCDRIIPDPDQPRREFDPEALRELATSLVDRGQLQPIRVRWSDEAARWVIIDGERRWRATVLADLHRIKCEMAPESEFGPLCQDPSEILVDQLVANCCRQDLRPIEQAEAFRRVMRAKGCSAAMVGRLAGVSRSTVARSLALLDLPDAVLDRVVSGDLSPSAAYELSKLDPADQVAAASSAVEGGLTRGAVAESVRQATGSPSRRKVTPADPADWRMVPIIALALATEARDPLVRAGVDYTFQAWELVESGELVDLEGMTPRLGKLIESAIVGLREEAGDPAPMTLALPEPAPPPPPPSMTLAPGEGRGVPGRPFAVLDLDDDDEVDPASILPPWRSQAFTDYQELALANLEGVEVLARANGEAGLVRVLAALNDATARVRLALGLPPGR